MTCIICHNNNNYENNNNKKNFNICISKFINEYFIDKFLIAINLLIMSIY